MTPMKSGCHSLRLAATGFEPVGWGQDIGEVFLGVDTQAAAVFHYDVEDSAFLAGLFIADERSILGSELGGANGVFQKVVANFKPTFAKTGSEVRPLVDCVLEPAVNHAAFGGAHGLAQGRANFGLV